MKQILAKLLFMIIFMIVSAGIFANENRIKKLEDRVIKLELRVEMQERKILELESQNRNSTPLRSKGLALPYGIKPEMLKSILKELGNEMKGTKTIDTMDKELKDFENQLDIFQKELGQE